MQVQAVLILFMKQDGLTGRAFYAKNQEPGYKPLIIVKEAVPKHAGADEPIELIAVPHASSLFRSIQ